jgi:hypothetical protein
VARGDKVVVWVCLGEKRMKMGKVEVYDARGKMRGKRGK